MAAKSGSGSFTWGLLAGGVALIGAGVLYYTGIFGTSPEPVPEPAEQAAQAEPQPQDTAEPAQEGNTDPQSATEEAEEHAAAKEPAPSEHPAPVLDQIYVEKDGNALLSGSAVPGSSITVLLDGAKVHDFIVDNSGSFAEFLSLPFSDAARGLVLEGELDGQKQLSDDYLIAALPEPEPQPEQVASAESIAPEPAAEPAQETASADPQDSPAQEPAAQVAQADTDTGSQEQGTEAAAIDDAADASTNTDTAETVQPAETAETASAEQLPQPETTETPAPESTGQVAILRSGEDGVELVQSPAKQADVPTGQVTLDTIGYSESGDVQLSGRAQPRAVIRLYLDNRAITDMPTSDQGRWRGEIEGIEPGIYTLRLDEIGGDGTVLSRLETPFKRESLEVLQPATPVVTAEASTEAPATTTTAETAPAAIAETESPVPAPTPAPAIRAVTVQKGDTLWAISRERYGDGFLYVRVFDANRESIRDPDLIYPGQVFTIPE